jgi:hypothetical protein
MNTRSPLPFGHNFLDRRIIQHVREFHSQHSRNGIEGGVSRRNFWSAAVTAGLSSSLWLTQFASANEIKTALPKPIPGGVSPLGIFIHHFPALPTATPLQNLSDPSQITDFKGFVGLNRIRGAGWGTGFADPLAFQADMGFMKGVFIGEDGKQHHGDFGFI